MTTRVFFKACPKCSKEKDFEIRTCSDAFSALEFVEYDKCDVVLSDIKMPAVSGLELLEHVHRFDPDIPVIMMTGQADIETAIGLR